MLGIIEAMRQSHSIVPGKADVGGGTRCVKPGMDSSRGRDLRAAKLSQRLCAFNRIDHLTKDIMSLGLGLMASIISSVMRYFYLLSTSIGHDRPELAGYISEIFIHRSL